jgi:hypothetical protein
MRAMRVQVHMLLNFAPILLATTQNLAPEAKQFDFWLGEWTCEGISYHPTDPKKNQPTTAENRIIRDFDGHVIHEHFKMGTFVGQSWSVYNAAAKRWQQTWVDNQGSYIALAGTFQNGKMILTTLPAPKKPKSFSRMVFSNFKPGSFDWDWEGSTDGGKTWKRNWHLHYTRKK